MTDADLDGLERRWAKSHLAVGDAVLALVAEVRRLRASLPPAGESVSRDDPRYRVVVEYRDGFGLATFWAPGCDGMSTGVHLLADAALGQMLAAEAWRGECDRLRAENDRLKRGDFTPDEFQALCHHLDGTGHCTRAAFEAGCRAYQDKLFGPPPASPAE